MNQGKVWRVVSPSVGVPLFLGSVAVASLIVHGALMIKTDWYGGYWNGGSQAGRSFGAGHDRVAGSNAAEVSSLDFCCALKGRDKSSRPVFPRPER